ncbi:hypothetical protein cyc_08107 [Cyclospora cayetanensis]|uniref:Uncharacterized protein n=1 Tax=Cyclospora cayetanensis TaxID=88456 RepID=A0A1D3CUH2_9EIME|nr:hypothetical protein cyc_08107 [Cyclospora cayetanensis]
MQQEDPPEKQQQASVHPLHDVFSLLKEGEEIQRLLSEAETESKRRREAEKAAERERKKREELQAQLRVGEVELGVATDDDAEGIFATAVTDLHGGAAAPKSCVEEAQDERQFSLWSSSPEELVDIQLHLESMEDVAAAFDSRASSCSAPTGSSAASAASSSPKQQGLMQLHDFGKVSFNLPLEGPLLQQQLQHPFCTLRSRQDARYRRLRSEAGFGASGFDDVYEAYPISPHTAPLSLTSARALHLCKKSSRSKEVKKKGLSTRVRVLPPGERARNSESLLGVVRKEKGRGNMGKNEAS